jgi:hypothetical protein
MILIDHKEAIFFRTGGRCYMSITTRQFLSDFGAVGVRISHYRTANFFKKRYFYIRRKPVSKEIEFK